MNTHRLLFSLLLACALVGCSSPSSRGRSEAAANVMQGAPNLMIQYGCPTCHVIPGVPGAVGKVGPSLDSLGQRSFLAGVLPNSNENLQRWLMHPQAIHPGTAMPEMGVTPSDAQQIALYLQAAR
jgi:cytochrome c